MKLLLFVLLCLSFRADAQFTDNKVLDADGKPIGNAYPDVKGSPYLFENWQKGKVRTADGKIYQNIDLKYNEVDDKVVFKGTNDGMMAFITPVAEFELSSETLKTTQVFVTGLPATDKITGSSFLQKISTGKLSLYKKYSVAIIESSGGYGAQTGSKLFNPSSAYYLLSNGSLKKISMSKKNIIALMPDKEQQISDFIKNNKTDFKNDEDLSKLFDNMNTL